MAEMKYVMEMYEEGSQPLPKEKAQSLKAVVKDEENIIKRIKSIL